MLLNVDAFALLSVLAYLVLTAAGAVVWRRSRSLASALVTVGFAMVFIDHLALLIQDTEIASIMRGHAPDTLFIVPHRLFWRCLGLIGLWLAAAGLVSYGQRLSAR